MKALLEIILVKDERLNHLQKWEDIDFSAIPVKGDYLRLHPYNHLEVIERHILYYPNYAHVECFVEDHSRNAILNPKKSSGGQTDE